MTDAILYRNARRQYIYYFNGRLYDPVSLREAHVIVQWPSGQRGPDPDAIRQFVQRGERVFAVSELGAIRGSKPFVLNTEHGFALVNVVQGLLNIAYISNPAVANDLFGLYDESINIPNTRASSQQAQLQEIPLERSPLSHDLFKRIDIKNLTVAQLHGVPITMIPAVIENAPFGNTRRGHNPPSLEDESPPSRNIESLLSQYLQPIRIPQQQEIAPIQSRRYLPFQEAGQYLQSGTIAHFIVDPQNQIDLAPGLTRVTLIGIDSTEYDVVARYDSKTKQIYPPY